MNIPYADTNEGRLLMALRAGPLESDQLIERLGLFCFQNGAKNAKAAGLVTAKPIQAGAIYALTDAGKSKCPTRRSLIGWVPPECRTVASQSELMETA